MIAPTIEFVGATSGRPFHIGRRPIYRIYEVNISHCAAIYRVAAQHIAKISDISLWDAIFPFGKRYVPVARDMSPFGRRAGRETRPLRGCGGVGRTPQSATLTAPLKGSQPLLRGVRGAVAGEKYLLSLIYSLLSII